MPIFVPSSAGSVSNGIIEPSQRIFSPSLGIITNTSVSGSVGGTGTLWLEYLGQLNTAQAFANILFWVSTAGTGTQAAEAGLFSSPLPPTASVQLSIGSGQTYTCLAFSSTTDSILSTGLKSSTTSMSGTTIPAGTYLWAGLRIQMGTTNPSLSGIGVTADSLPGITLTIGTNTAMTVNGTYSGLTQNSSARLLVTLD